MKVIPKIKEYIAIKIEYNKPQFYVDIGKYLDEKDYQFVRQSVRYRDVLQLKNGNDIINCDDGDYILINIENKLIRYVPERQFKDDYIEIVDNEKVEIVNNEKEEL